MYTQPVRPHVMKMVSPSESLPYLFACARLHPRQNFLCAVDCILEDVSLSVEAHFLQKYAVAELK